MPASTSMCPLARSKLTTRLNSRHVEQDRVAAELLAAHRVPAAGDADAATLARGLAQSELNVVCILRGNDSMHARGIELRLDVVDLDARRLFSGICPTCEDNVSAAPSWAAPLRNSRRDDMFPSFDFAPAQSPCGPAKT